MKARFKHIPRANVAIFLAFFTFFDIFVFAQAPGLGSASNAPLTEPTLEELPGPAAAISQSGSLPDDRIFGVMPNYLTVENPEPNTEPLTVKEKFELFAKETFDPFTFAASAGGAAISQLHNGDPVYGHGWGAYADRFGAAVGDVSTQNFFSDAVLASILHEDPRYFRKGPEYGVWSRVGYALSRSVITRTDAGKERFNFSGVLGMSMGIALSNAYYPDPSVNGTEVASRFGTSMLATALGNLLPEFWPDIHERFVHRKPRHLKPRPTPPSPTAAPGD